MWLFNWFVTYSILMMHSFSESSKKRSLNMNEPVNIDACEPLDLIIVSIHIFEYRLGSGSIVTDPSQMMFPETIILAIVGGLSFSVGSLEMK